MIQTGFLLPAKSLPDQLIKPVITFSSDMMMTYQAKPVISGMTIITPELKNTETL